MTLPLFFASEVQQADEDGYEPVSVPLSHLEAGQNFVLCGTEAHHIGTVRRLTVGDELFLADGRGTRVVASLSGVAKNSVTAHVESTQLFAALEPQVRVVQALAKGGRDEAAVELCTELGADSFVPWQSDRAIVRWEKQKAAKGKQKWQNTVFAAAKQSRRPHFPEVSDCLNTSQLVEAVKEATQAGECVLLCHEEATAALPDVLSQNKLSSRIWIIVGPEGGISPQETENLIAAGAVSVSLGNLVLRSSTAAGATLSIINYVTGRIWPQG